MEQLEPRGLELFFKSGEKKEEGSNREHSGTVQTEQRMADLVDPASLDRMVRLQSRQRPCIQQLGHDCRPNNLPCRGLLLSLNNVLPLSYDQENARLDLCHQRSSHGPHYHNPSRRLR